MMSQLSCHKVPLRGEKQVVQRSRGLTKASGDATMRCKPAEPRSKSKSNKIPKNLRLELENALVGLCDVWFEEIKPHLIRNNIKLHINSEVAAAAGGDHEELPAGAPGCSHLDPATTAGECQLCRLLLNAASSIENAMSQAANAAPLPAPSPSNGGNSDYRNVDCRKCRRRRHPQQPSCHDWRVPRICRTYSLLNANARNTSTETTTANKHPSRQRLQIKRKICVDKSTQTEISQLCMKRQGWGVKSTTLRPRAAGRTPSPKSNRSPTPKSNRSKSSKLTTPSHSNRDDTIDDKLNSPYLQSFAKEPSNLGKFRQGGKHCLRTPAGVRDRQKVYEAVKLGRMAKKSIYWIDDQCDTGKVLQLLYQNPKEDNPNSIMNLIMSVHRRNKYKKQPWR